MVECNYLLLSNCAFGLSGACMSQGVTFPLPMKKGFGATDKSINGGKDPLQWLLILVL